VSNAPLTLDQVRRAIGQEPSTADQVRNAAVLISLTFAVLSAFATQRATSLGKQDGSLGDFDEKELRRDTWIDIGLAVFGLLLLVALSPLLVAAVAEITLLEVKSAFFVVFCLLYAGLAVVLLWIARTMWRRVSLLGTKASRAPAIRALLPRRPS
jgi:hypothetical protein